MPAYGRSEPQSSNILAADQLPVLPVPLYDGKLSISMSFEGHPSGTIEYPSATEEFLATLETAYAAGLEKFSTSSNTSITTTTTAFRSVLNIMGSGNGVSLVSAISSTSLALQTAIAAGTAEKIVVGDVYLKVNTFSYDPEKFEHESGVTGRTYNVKIGLVGYHEFAVSKPINLKGLPRSSKGKIAIGAIAGAAGIPYSGPSFEITADGDTASFADILQNNARRLGCFVDYCGPTVALKPYDGVANWSFSDQELIDEGENTLEVPPSFRDLEITGPFLNTNQSTVIDNADSDFRQREPVIETIIEEDDDFDLPPEGTLVLRSLDSNFDMSGPKKVRKQTTLMDGSAVLEETFIKGFAYTSEQIHVGEGLLFTDSPADFWGLVEYQRSEPIYEKLPALVSIEVSAVDPGTKKSAPLLLHPDYEDLVSSSRFGGDTSISLSLNTEFLTLNKIGGWILNRLLKENGSTADGRQVGSTLDGQENPFYPFMQFKREPKQDQTAYRLKSVREKFGGDLGLPFSIDWVGSRDELDQRLKSRIPPSYEGKIGVITPDLNFVEPLYVETESRRAGSFTWAIDPEASPPDFQPTPLLTGEESYSRSDRKILSSNKYREKVSEASAKDSNFGSFIESVRFREQLGRPPEASNRQKPWEKVDNPPRTVRQEQVTRHFLTSDLLNDQTPSGGSVDCPNAESISEAIKKVEMDLRIAGLQTANSSKKVSWYYPQIRPGDIIYAGSDRFTVGRGFWRSLSVTWEQEYKGRNNNYGFDPIVTCPGTQLSLGLDRKRVISSAAQTSKVPNANSGDPEVSVNANFGTHALGKVLANTSNRRNF